MSNLFKKPDTPSLPPLPKPLPPIKSIKEVAIVEESATEAQRRKKRSISGRGKASTIISGITLALKKRFGE